MKDPHPQDSERGGPKDQILGYLESLQEAEEGLEDPLDGISRFVADYPLDDLDDSPDDAIRVNGVTNRTRRGLTEAYAEAVKRDKEKRERLKDLYTTRIRGIRLRRRLILCACVVLSFTAGMLVDNRFFNKNEELKEPQVIVISQELQNNGRNSQLERMRMEGFRIPRQGPNGPLMTR